MAFARTKHLFDLAVVVLLESAAFPLLVFLSFLAKFSKKKLDVGIGPEPLINNPFHKRALEGQGYTAETFVRNVWHTTSDFDVRGDLAVPFALVPYYLFVKSIFRYRCVYLYFNGGPLGWTRYLWPYEAWLYKLANVKTVVMPYGSDVAELTRTPNLLLRHAYSKDYPNHRLRHARTAAQVELWSTGAAHVIGGCDWVDYLFHWDTLMVAHFSIDPEKWRPAPTTREGGPLRLLHAPNHRTLKGTRFFEEAVRELNEEGVPVELVILEGVPNSEVQRLMATVDVIADQLVIGWYAMFTLEGLMMEKPVICYLRSDLEELYVRAGLLAKGEVPIVNASPATVKEKIRWLAQNRDQLAEIGRRSREYAIKHHSLEAIGAKFRAINTSLGVPPSKPAAPAPQPLPKNPPIASIT